MSSKISTFTKCTDPKPNGQVDWTYVLESIKSDKFKDLIIKAREIKESKDNGAYVEFKKTLPVVTFGGIFPYRKNDSIQAPTGFLIPDMDHVEDVSRVMDLLQRDENIWFAFVSPSGCGIKAGVRAKGIKNDQDHKKFFAAVQRYLEKTYQIKIDDACKDISRLTFLSYDPDAWVNPDACFFDIEYWSKEPDQGLKVDVKDYIGNSSGKEKYSKKVLQSCCEKIRQSQIGTMHSTRLRMSKLIGGYLQYIPEEDVYSALEQAVTDSGTKDFASSMKTIRDGLEYGKKSPIDLDAVFAQRQPEEQSPFKLLDIQQMLEIDIPEREFVVDPVIPQQGLIMVYGPRGIAKTWFVLSLAYGIASGGLLFGGWKAPRPRKAIVIDGEMPARTMKERLTSIVAGAESEPPDPSFLQILTPDLQNRPMPNLAQLNSQKEISSLIKDYEIIIVDNLACLARHGRENDSESWLPVQSWLLELRRTGKTVILVHHAGKGGAQRGTSSREDILDTVISLRKPSDHQPSEGARVEVHLDKSRGVFGEKANPFELTLRTDHDGAHWLVRSIDDVDLDRVMSLKADGLSIREISQETGLTRSKVHRLLKKGCAA